MDQKEKAIEHRRCHTWAHISDNYVRCLLLNKLTKLCHAQPTFQFHSFPHPFLLNQIFPTVFHFVAKRENQIELPKVWHPPTHSRYILHPHLCLDGEVNKERFRGARRHIIYYPRAESPHEGNILHIIIHSKYFPVSDWLKPHV